MCIFMVNEAMAQKQEVLNAMANIEYYPVVRNECLLAESTKIPISDIATLGIAAFAPILDVVNQVTSTAPTLPEALPQLFTVDMRGYTGELAALHDGSGFLSTVIGSHGEGMLGQAAFVPVNTEALTAVPNSAVVLDPVLILCAALILSMNHKMNMIQKSSNDILEYLKIKDKAELRAHLETLIEIQNTYKTNIDNERYKLLKGAAVERIKTDAEKYIITYRNQIKAILGEKKLPHSNKNTKEKLQIIEDDLDEYQLAVYLYSYSTFLETLLLENFKKGYLQNVIEKIEKYSIQYRELYEQCYDFIEEYMNTSISTQATKGIATISKFAGETLAKVPVLSKGTVDEMLIETGDKLENKEKQTRQKALQNLVNKQSSYIRPFVDNIKKMDEIYNEPKIIMLDRDNLYLVKQECLA